MLICHINNIENKWNKNSEGVTTGDWKSSNGAFRRAGSELRLRNDHRALLPLPYAERTTWQQDFQKDIL